MEVNHSGSKKDFRHKISICAKEANETKHWLRMLAVALPNKKDICREFWKETHALTLIFATIAKNVTV